MRTSLFVGAATLVCAAAVALSAMAGETEERVVLKPPFGQSKPTPGSSTQILYHGGPVLTGTVPLYVIYYGGTGAFPTNSQAIINAFLGGLRLRDTNRQPPPSTKRLLEIRQVSARRSSPGAGRAHRSVPTALE